MSISSWMLWLWYQCMFLCSNALRVAVVFGIIYWMFGGYACISSESWNESDDEEMTARENAHGNEHLEKCVLNGSCVEYLRSCCMVAVNLNLTGPWNMQMVRQRNVDGIDRGVCQ